MTAPTAATTELPQAATGPVVSLGGLELRLARPVTTQETGYLLEARLVGGGADLFFDGGSLQLHNQLSGLVDEVFFAPDGTVAQTLPLEQDTDLPLTLALCDGLGDIVATAPLTLRHRSAADAVTCAPAATLSRAVALGVLGRSGQRRKQIVAPAGASLPGRFPCVCRTADQCGRIVLPLWQEDRLLHQLIVNELDSRLPIGTPVEVVLEIEADRSMALRAILRQAGRSELVRLPAPAPLARPSDQDVERVTQRVAALLPDFTGQFGAELAERLRKGTQALQEALARNEDEKAASVLADLDQQREQMELARLQIEYPPRQRLTLLVKRCLYEAANVADRTGRDREQLFAPIYSQEQTAEQAHGEKNVALYRECFDHLRALAADLQRLQDDLSPASRRDQDRPATAHDVQDALRDLQAYIGAVLPAAQLKGREEFVQRLRDLEQQQPDLADRGKREAALVLREVRKLLGEVGGMEQELSGGRAAATVSAEGMLEGSA